MITDFPLKTEYDKLLEYEPYYTPIPDKYWVSKTELNSLEYVKKRTGLLTITIQDLYQACKTYPEIFAYWMLGITLRPYQIHAIYEMDTKNHVAMAWSRRTGKSTITKTYMLWTSRFNKLPGEMTGTTWNVILQDQEIANTLYVEPIHEMMEKGDKIVNKNFKGKLGTNFFTSALVTKRDKFGKVRANQITFKTETGICRINTMPPTNKAIGREGNLIGDEVSKWKENPKCKDEFKFYDQLIAIMKDNPNYKAIFLTTPEGDQDMFAKNIFDPNQNDPNNRYTKIWYPWQVRTEQTWYEELKKTEAESIKNGRHHLYQQEYESKFVSISEPFFPHKLTTTNLQDNWQKHTSNTPCSLGIDWEEAKKAKQH